MRNYKHINRKNAFFLYMGMMLSFGIFSCDDSKTVNKPTTDFGSKPPTAKMDTALILAVEGLPLGYENFRFVGNLKARFKSDEEIDCNNWLLSKKNIKEILSSFEKVSGTEWGARCYVYPCTYHGQVTNGKFKYNISINAASHVTLTREDEILYFIRSSTSPLFMQPCDCCE